MKNRPDAPMKIYEVEGEKDVVVVIPTADHNGQYANTCKNEIFKGQQIIFVESNGPFFNYARSCNFGLKYALKYNPKWVVLSNDDMYKIDEFSKLKSILSKLDETKLDVVFCKLNSACLLVKKTKLSFLAENFITISKFRKEVRGIESKFNINYKFVSKGIGNIFISKKRKLMLLFLALLSKKVEEAYTIGSFSVFSYSFVNSLKKVFDETYINGEEDADLSIFISKHKNFLYIDFLIGQVGGASLGKGLNSPRSIRGLANRCYLSNKFSSSSYTEI